MPGIIAVVAPTRALSSYPFAVTAARCVLLRGRGQRMIGKRFLMLGDAQKVARLMQIVKSGEASMLSTSSLIFALRSPAARRSGFSRSSPDTNGV